MLQDLLSARGVILLICLLSAAVVFFKALPGWWFERGMRRRLRRIHDDLELLKALEGMTDDGSPLHREAIASVRLHIEAQMAEIRTLYRSPEHPIKEGRYR